MKLSPQIPVAVFLTSFHPGGTERQMTALIEGLDRREFDVHVACFHREGAWLPRVEAAAEVTAFPIRGFARPATMAQAASFVRWCRARRIQVVQTCDLYANAFALPAAALAGVPVRIGSRRELNPDKSAGQIRLQRHAYRCAHAVVANSPAAAAQLEAEGVLRQRVQVIPNGLDLSRFAPREPRERVSSFITVANLRREKAHEILIDAAARLLPQHPGLTFTIVGDGPRRDELEALAAAKGVAQAVRFVGHREDVPALLRDADVFVLPSRSEAFPNGAMEAMAAGLPVVASAVGGLLDLVDHGRTGTLVPADDAPALAAALASFVHQPARAAEMGAAARRTVAERYSFERMFTAFAALYRSQLLQRGERRYGIGRAA